MLRHNTVVKKAWLQIVLYQYSNCRYGEKTVMGAGGVRYSTVIQIVLYFLYLYSNVRYYITDVVSSTGDVASLDLSTAVLSAILQFDANAVKMLCTVLARGTIEFLQREQTASNCFERRRKPMTTQQFPCFRFFFVYCFIFFDYLCHYRVIALDSN